ncbi:lasso peptide isopeptide bond-forming cyclase [Anabaena sp. CCY 9402-a]|uniref:lasso peptide isopeptide bond-forming cyclase n=1 Tax=Anabaena sp. CCY 9402-a TaxID=3103867 RepID=UPI0039C668A3
MSGIVGIYQLNGQPVDHEQLTRMVDAIAHRGPDGADIWCSGSVGLGHRMLWTTPESLQEKLPMLNPAGNLVLTADVRIDNRDELISALQIKHYPAEKITDSYLVLAAYEQWGEQCPKHLIGDFAFAIWDERKQQLFCARDAMGVKPLYYYRFKQTFIFASEIKSLLTFPGVPCQINEAMVADYLAKILFCGRKEDSFYTDIRELRAAESLTISPNRTEIKSYWCPDLSYELNLSSDEQYVEAFREIFMEAVRCRLRSAFPIGSTLSGGLDSSSIACTARQLLAKEGRQKLHTFSAIFPSLAEISPKIDERPYMAAVLAQGDYQAHDVHADQLSPLMDVDQVYLHGEEPIPAPNFYMDWAVFKAASEQNLRVLFTGIDGDTTITYGFQYLSELAASFRWLKLMEEGTALAKVWKKSARHVIWNYGLKSVVPEPIVEVLQRLRGSYQTDDSLEESLTLLNPEFAQRLGMAERMQTETVKSLMDQRSSMSAREAHWLALNNGSVRYALQWLDKTAAAFSLEARHPFCDRRLVEFCLALPSSQKLHKGWTRSILRRAMEGILPKDVQWRLGKGNLGANFRLRLLGDERATLEQVIFQESHLIENYVNILKLQSAYSRYAANPNAADPESVDIFVAVNLALWIKQSGVTATANT